MCCVGRGSFAIGHREHTIQLAGVWFRAFFHAGGFALPEIDHADRLGDYRPTFSGRAALKDLVALFIGIFSALFFTGCYYFLTDRLATLPDVFVQALTSGQVFWKIMPEKVVAFVVIGVLIVVSLYNVVVNYPMAIVAQRRGMLSMLSMLLFVGSSLFFIPFNCHGITLITAIPLSYMFTQYFISHRTRWLGNVLFLLFIAACVLLVL